MKMKAIFNTLILLLFISLLVSCEKKDSDSKSYPYSYLDEPDFIVDGLIGYYPFNGDTKDYSGNSNDAIALNSTYSADRFNHSNAAIHFDGIDDFIQIPSICKLLVNNEGSIITWSKLDTTYTTSNQPKPVVFSIVDSTNASFLLFNSFSNLGYSYGMYPKLSSTSSITSVNKRDFKLSIITFTDNSITIYYYSDGSLEKESLSNPTNSFGFNGSRKNQDLLLGKSIIETYDSDSFDYYFTYFKGDIDDLLIYKRILTDDEIKFIFNLAKD